MADESPGRREENARATRAALVAVATGLFARKGFLAAGIEEIAAEAGVTSGALYHHFQSKRGLFRAAVEAMERNLMERAVAAGSKHSDPWRGLRAGISETLKATSEGEAQHILLREAPNVLGAAEWREIEDQFSYGMLRGAVEGLMGAGVLAPGSPEMVARMLVSLITELAILIAESDDPAISLGEAEELLDRVLPSLRAADESATDGRR